MGLFGKSKKEREKEYMNRLDVPLCLKEDFELIIDDVFTIMGVGTIGPRITSLLLSQRSTVGFEQLINSANSFCVKCNSFRICLISLAVVYSGVTNNLSFINSPSSFMITDFFFIKS